MKLTQKLIAMGMLLVSLAMLAVGCGGGQQEETAPVRSGEVTVEMRGMKYVPAKLTVKKGARITFVNRDAVVHDVIQVAVKELGKAAPGFDSGVIDPGKSWSIHGRHHHRGGVGRRSAGPYRRPGRGLHKKKAAIPTRADWRLSRYYGRRRQTRTSQGRSTPAAGAS
jgi:plastocyanin